MMRIRKMISAGIILLCSAAAFAAAAYQRDVCKQAVQPVETACMITEPKMGDAKIMKDKMVSGTDGHMIIFNFDGSVFREYPDIPLNWLYVYEQENLIAAGNGKNEIRLLVLNDDWTVKTDKELSIEKSDEVLKIDPTIIKAGDTYMLTYIDIVGSVNNGDPDAENGIYTVRCMRSEDCLHWTKLTDILSCQNNIEDADMIYTAQGELCYFFEKEQYDKGPSSIHVIVSKDHGVTWGDEAELVPAVADNELASVNARDDGYEMYYSSDRDLPGMSYEGAKIYKAVFDSSFVLEHEDVVDINEDKGILLYDTKKMEDGLYILYVQNYSTENNLVLKKLQLTDGLEKEYLYLNRRSPIIRERKGKE